MIDMGRYRRFYRHRHPFVPTARKRSAQARSWKPGRRRQRWKPEGGETREARLDAKHESAARPCLPGRGTHMQKRVGSVDLLQRTMNRHGFGFADPAQPVRRALTGRQVERGGDSPPGFPLECKRERVAPKARRHL